MMAPKIDSRQLFIFRVEAWKLAPSYGFESKQTRTDRILGWTQHNTTMFSPVPMSTDCQVTIWWNNDISQIKRPIHWQCVDRFATWCHVGYSSLCDYIEYHRKISHQESMWQVSVAGLAIYRRTCSILYWTYKTFLSSLCAFRHFSSTVPWLCAPRNSIKVECSAKRKRCHCDCLRE